jgi:arsenate reductase
MDTVLFACVHNAGRSQIAAAWLTLLADPSKVRALSAGTQPGAHVHPEVVTVMKEVGVDLSNEAPKVLNDSIAQSATWLITMGCGEACPVIAGVRRDDWPLDDPKGKPIEQVRLIRDEIAERVRALIELEGWGE